MIELEQDIKKLIIESLNLEDLTIDDIDSHEPIFGDGLGLDSIDALELGIAIKKQYKLTLDGKSEENQKYFSSVSTLAEFIGSQNSSLVKE